MRGAFTAKARVTAQRSAAAPRTRRRGAEAGAVAEYPPDRNPVQPGGALGAGADHGEGHSKVEQHHNRDRRECRLSQITADVGEHGRQVGCRLPAGNDTGPAGEAT